MLPLWHLWYQVLTVFFSFWFKQNFLFNHHHHQQQQWNLHYYHNITTGVSTFDRPSGFETSRQPVTGQNPVELGQGGWAKFWDDENECEFYFHEERGASQFERPIGKKILTHKCNTDVCLFWCFGVLVFWCSFLVCPLATRIQLSRTHAQVKHQRCARFTTGHNGMAKILWRCGTSVLLLQQFLGWIILRSTCILSSKCLLLLLQSSLLWLITYDLWLTTDLPLMTNTNTDTFLISTRHPAEEKVERNQKNLSFNACLGGKTAKNSFK
jgi:hypothetical protein